MPAPTTVDEFVDLVRKSAVLEDARLSSYVQKIKADPATPKGLSDVAGIFVRDGLITFFQAEQFLQGKWKRFSIGKYKVLEKLGSGGMGQVFLCEHKLMRRRVAVKVLPTAKATDPSSLDRFYREARAVAALDHPNIVRAYDIDQDDNLHFLVMEYVDGASLQEMIRRTGPMDPLRACHYMYWSAIGLQHAHANGLIHRDIKPGNILVDRTGVVKILDLGLARFFHDEDDAITKKYDESVLGTADYLAPEQAVDSHGVDGRADIYSLGATFYFLLTGQPPFADGSVAQKLLWHQSKTPKPLRTVRPEVPEAVDAIVAKMMAKKPEDRYQTPGELAEAMQPFTHAEIPPPPEAEMPQLSAAAMGTASGPVSILANPRPTAGQPRTPAPLQAPKPAPVQRPAPSGQKPKLPAPQPAASPPRSGPGVAVADADTQKNKPGPVVEPIAETPIPNTPIWETISAETANNSRADTDRTKRDGSSRRTKPAPKSSTGKSKVRKGPGSPERRLPVKLILAGAGGLILLGALAATIYWFGFHDRGPKSSATQPAGEPRRLVLSKNAGPLHYPTFAKALQEFKPGDTIVLEDDWEEFGAASQVKGLTIAAAEGKHPTWRAPANKPGSQVLSLAGTEGAKITGITFEANANVDHAIRLQGACPNLTIEGCELVNAKVAALAIHDCVGDKNRPVVIRKVQITNPAGKAAVLFTANASTKKDYPAVGSHGIVFQNCLIEGPTAGAAILFDGSAATDIRNCRFWKGVYGLHFRKAIERPASDFSWQVNVIGNTFHSQTGAAVWIEEAGHVKLRPENAITFNQNYFAGMPVVFKVDGDLTGAKFLNVDVSNFRKTGVPPAAPPTVPIAPMPETPDDVIIDPANPAKLLTYDRNSPLFKAFNGKPVGAPPE
jgi:eukaryotic-like serine/threonine-protein kinase